MKILTPLLLFLFLLFPLASQDIDMDRISAQEEFRLAVVAFHQGFYNKAIHSFERSLMFKPEDSLVRQWLGRAYYQSGYEDAAINEWDNLINASQADSALLAFRDTVARRRGLLDELRQRDPWVELLSLQNDRDGEPMFSRPTSVASSVDGDGHFYTVSFASNMVSRFNPNGDRVEHLNGGVDGFHRPFDIMMLPDSRFLVSEYQGDRVSLFGLDGYRQLSYGGTGRGPGNLLGPQFLALSGEYFYVSDWGNKQVDKYSLQGDFILSFGQRQGDFPGLQGPSGVALTPHGIAVSDNLAAVVYLFDESGNFLRTLVDRGLAAPEGLTMGEDGRLLIADGNRVLAYDFLLDSAESVFQSPMEESRILKVCFDENGNLVIPDFNSNTISLQTELSTLYGGLFLRIDRVDSRDYPNVIVDITVEDLYGRPYVGLDGNNFLIKEGPQYLSQHELLAAGYENQDIYCSMVLENSSALEQKSQQLEYSLMDILGRSRRSDQFSLWSLSSTPYEISNQVSSMITDFKEQWDFVAPSQELNSVDVGIRMAASQMIESRKRRVLMYFSTGDLGNNAFETFGLVELASYLKNNNILFYPVYISSQQESDELNYIARQTGGRPFHSLDPQGLGPIFQEVRAQNQGSYTLQFRATASNDFGREYVPLILEVNYLQKSGRDELGYFAPIDYSPR